MSKKSRKAMTVASGCARFLSSMHPKNGSFATTNHISDFRLQLWLPCCRRDHVQEGGSRIGSGRRREATFISSSTPSSVMLDPQFLGQRAVDGGQSAAAVTIIIGRGRDGAAS